MEKKPPLKMTPFDQMVTSSLLQTMKLLIQYLPPDIQRMAGIYAKVIELENAIYYFQPPYYHSRRGRLRQKELRLDSMIEDLRPYLPPDTVEMLDNLTQAMGMMEMMQNLNMEDIMQTMNMEDVMSAFHMDHSACRESSDVKEREDEDERLDESSGDEEYRPNQAGTHQECGEPDQREER